MRMSGLWVWTALVMGAMAGACAAEEEPDKRFKDRVYRVEPGETVPHEGARKKIRAYRKKHGVSDRTLKAKVVSIYRPSRGVQRRLRRLVPLDEEGRPHGRANIYWRVWHSVKHVIHYRHGERHGVEKIRAGHNPNDAYLWKKIPWKNGEIHGTRQIFYENGQLMTETPYREGKVHGTSKSYDKEGRLQRVAPYRNGQKHGTMKDFWPETGEPRRIIPYQKGKVHGTVKEFYKNSQLKRRVSFKRDTMHGVEKQYTPKGKLRTERYWLNGERVSRQRYRSATSSKEGEG